MATHTKTHANPETSNSKHDLHVIIVYTRWHGRDVVQPLLTACKTELLGQGIPAFNIKTLEVAGTYELPYVATRVIQAKHRHVDAVICIGCMVKGATMAYEYVSQAAIMSLMKLNVATDTPVINGILTCEMEASAATCAKTTGDDNWGVIWARAAVEMGRLKRGMAKVASCACSCHCDTKDCSCSCHCAKCACNTCTCKKCECDDCAKGSTTAKLEKVTLTHAAAVEASQEA